MRGRRMVLKAPLVLLVAAGAALLASPPLHADLTFVCNWWSEAQMNGLNPNAPPPKNTEVTITKWEYSDPIGVPHPDVIEIVLALQNDGSQPMSGLEIELTGQWRIGPLRTAARAAWTERAALKKFQDVSVGPASTQKLRVPVDLKAKMDPLYKRGRWPHTLRITAVVRQPGAAAPVARAQADLPIRPGD